MLIFYLRPARKKARHAATTEALCLLRDLDPIAPPGGPLSDEGGLFWIILPKCHLTVAARRFGRLGYTRAVDLVEPIAEDSPSVTDAALSQERVTRWRRRSHRLVRLYEEDPAALREMAPDRRVFLFESRF